MIRQTTSVYVESLLLVGSCSFFSYFCNKKYTTALEYQSLSQSKRISFVHISIPYIQANLDCSRHTTWTNNSGSCLLANIGYHYSTLTHGPFLTSDILGIQDYDVISQADYILTVSRPPLKELLPHQVNLSTHLLANYSLLTAYKKSFFITKVKIPHPTRPRLILRRILRSIDHLQIIARPPPRWRLFF